MDTLGEREGQNKRQFDALAASYDQLGFLLQTAQHVAQQVTLAPGAAVLDVMTGTGTVALALAARPDLEGSVVGADLSDGMLDVARAKSSGQAKVSWVQADATRLPFPDKSFDLVVCVSGLFFVPDMEAALREWRRVLRPGGEVVFSSFGKGLMGELPALWCECVGRHGVKPGFPPLGRIPSLEAAQELLNAAAYTEVSVWLDTIPYTLASPEARWADIEAGLEGAPLAQFSPEQRAQIRAEHLTELMPLFADGPLLVPLSVPLPVLIARGVR